MEREPFVEEAEKIFDFNEQSLIECYISAITPVNLAYIGRKFKDASQLHQLLISLLADFEICPINLEILQKAITSTIKDFEDAVQHESAIADGIDVIVTRDLKDFAGASLPVLSPADFLKTLPDTNNP